ncbi:HalOD1 output domain-containing protein [Halobiforma nitratireducens]|uniref:Halobacterial output domain-containing protein n=1 Tax=Halobiforma nitratireducens JCM 10879 TaxID=1227454 RepID=M0LBH0_9EURY|nr:HalOD1 output domain-containing protein [Halobiforma nitratireducens]EMA29310.1 hypothetical protein C446_17394 [Halobiforma nitratireducens JCM 10879]
MHPALASTLERIAAREDCSPTALPPLYDAVDPGAVATVLESPADATVRFEYDGYHVVVGPDPHSVSVSETEQ